MWTYLDAHPLIGLAEVAILCATVAFAAMAFADAYRVRRL